jgi:hypothetical protein
VTEARRRSPRILLVGPGAIGLYALLGAMWHPLLIGPGYDSFECVRRPWDFVFLGSWLIGAILIVVAVVLAITGRGRTSLSVAVTGNPLNRCGSGGMAGCARIPPLRQLNDVHDNGWPSGIFLAMQVDDRAFLAGRTSADGQGSGLGRLHAGTGSVLQGHKS